jgi:hypothetical protein
MLRRRPPANAVRLELGFLEPEMGAGLAAATGKMIRRCEPAPSALAATSVTEEEAAVARIVGGRLAPNVGAAVASPPLTAFCVRPPPSASAHLIPVSRRLHTRVEGIGETSTPRRRSALSEHEVVARTWCSRGPGE